MQLLGLKGVEIFLSETLYADISETQGNNELGIRFYSISGPSTWQ